MEITVKEIKDCTFIYVNGLLHLFFVTIGLKRLHSYQDVSEGKTVYRIDLIIMGMPTYLHYNSLEKWNKMLETLNGIILKQFN